MRKERSNLTRRILNATLIVAALIACTELLRLSGISNAVDRQLWEIRFTFDSKPVTGEIVVVDIDAKSLHELGVWPFPRQMHADLTTELAAAGARDILFDVDFSSRSVPENDQRFAEALEEAGNVSLAMFSQIASVEREAGILVNKPIDLFLDAAWPVAVMVPVEADGWVWQSLYGLEVGGSVELSASAFLGDYSGDAKGLFWNDYGIDPGGIQRVSFVDVLQGRADMTLFKDKKVIIGASALELQDLFYVPVHGLQPGSVIQALGAESLLQNRALQVSGERMVAAAAIAVLFLVLVSGIEGWVQKSGVLILASLAFETIGLFGLKNMAVLVPTTSGQIVLLGGGAAIVLRELGFHKLLSHMEAVRRRNSLKMLDHVFYDSFDAIVVIQAGGEITAANRMAKTLFSDDVVAGAPSAVVLPKQISDVLQAVAESGLKDRVGPLVLTEDLAEGQKRHLEYVVTRSEKVIVPSFGSRTEETVALACLTCRDVTEERRHAERLEHLARFDPATGLLNRHGFEQELANKVGEAHGDGRELCLLQLMIANLDQITASLGYSFADEIRKAVAARLSRTEFSEIVWSAISGATFAGVFEDPKDNACRSERIDRIVDCLAEEYQIGNVRLSVQVKLGYVRSGGTMSGEDLMRNAGNALAKVWRDPQASVLGFRGELEHALQRRQKLETELFKSIERDQLEVRYQPLVRLDTRAVFGAEALLRWEHHELGPISPVEFIPIAEESGFIVEMGEWVMKQAMREAMAWPQQLKLSVNLSPVQFIRSSVAGMVADAIKSTGFPAEWLDLEITESLFIDDGLDLQFHMEEIRATGCSFSLDDFGTGYSSLGYIGKYPFSKIKLDRCFVTEKLTGAKETAIIDAVVHIARSNGMSVLVEGIETPLQADRLTELGCDFGQGYHFGKPMVTAEFSQLLQDAA